jgi:trehalose-6-phosphate synthase
MLGVDRLDMIKGIPQKLLAYEKFLEVRCAGAGGPRAEG